MIELITPPCPAPYLECFQVQIAPERIAFLKFILEGYDNLATLSTIDRNTGLVKFCCPAELAGDLCDLLSDISILVKHDTSIS